jgi:FkbM family methyltransferase
MREELWWRLRESSALRKLYRLPLLASVMKKASLLLLPELSEKVLEVKDGPGKGFRFELNPRWQPNLWRGSYDPSADRIMEEYFKPGKTFYDIGGGIGFYSLVAARKGANVITLEPDPQNFACIQRHARMNKLDGKFRLLPLAAYSHTGGLLLQPSPVDDGRGHGNSHAQAVFGTDPSLCIEVRCTTLDDLARENPSPDLIKIDVEGAEAEVFRGAERLMRESGPPMLCEVHNAELGAEIQEILRERNYQSEWLDDESYTVRWLFARPQ